MVCPAIKLFVCVSFLTACTPRRESLGCLWATVFHRRLLIFIKLLGVMLKAGEQPSWAPSWSAYGKSHCLKVLRVQKAVAMG